MIVKHIYADWIGVVMGAMVNNGTTEFYATPDRLQQLEPYEPTIKEMRRLALQIKLNFPTGHNFYTKYLENRADILTTLHQEVDKENGEMYVEGDRFTLIFKDRTEIYLLKQDGTAQVMKCLNEPGATFTKPVDAGF